MRRLAVMAAATAALAAAAPAGAAEVELMVVGKERTLRAARDVTLAPERVRVGRRRCRVGARTPLGALARTRLRLRLRDYGSCGRRARDAGGLYVKRIGPDRARGAEGWVYKVGRRAGTSGAGDPSGPFGRGGLRDGQRLLWFWCRLDDRGACQRTLEARPAAREATPGSTLRVTVRGYDDAGRGVPVPGATVRLGSARAATDAEGVAEIVVPSEPGRARLTAEHPEMVRSFPSGVTIG